LFNIQIEGKKEVKIIVSFFALAIALVHLAAPIMLCYSGIKQLPRTEFIPDEPIKHNLQLKTESGIIDNELIQHEPQTRNVENITFPKSKQKPLVKVMTARAYYKPLVHQKKFRWGSYRADVSMNGKGEKTSTGKKPEVGIIAAYKKDFPSGTILFVEGYGYGVVEDKGSAVTRNRIDLFMGSGDAGLKKAIDWGVRKVSVEVIKLGT
jgi:3D (Asp-Asp-Asp) domain-containing protein